jgi:hypothetical protein
MLAGRKGLSLVRALRAVEQRPHFSFVRAAKEFSVLRFFVLSFTCAMLADIVV